MCHEMARIKYQTLDGTGASFCLYKKLRDVQQEREGARWSKFLQVMKHF